MTNHAKLLPSDIEEYVRVRDVAADVAAGRWTRSHIPELVDVLFAGGKGRTALEMLAACGITREQICAELTTRQEAPGETAVAGMPMCEPTAKTRVAGT